MLTSRLGRWTVGCFSMFCIVSALMSSGATQRWDVAVLQAIPALRTATFTAAMRMASTLGNGICAIPLAILIAVLLWRCGRTRAAWTFAVAALSGELLYALMKELFHRPRPAVIPHLSGADWYSYPSGHAMLAPIVWGSGLLLVVPLARSRVVRTSLRALAVVVPIAVALSRIYLGVHYPTDVVAGLCLGTAWALLWRGWDREPTGVELPAADVPIVRAAGESLLRH